MDQGGIAGHSSNCQFIYHRPGHDYGASQSTEQVEMAYLMQVLQRRRIADHLRQRVPPVEVPLLSN